MTVTVAPRPKPLLFVPFAPIVSQWPPFTFWFLSSTGARPDARDHDVELAVVVEVGDGQPAADARRLERRSALRR